LGTGNHVEGSATDLSSERFAVYCGFRWFPFPPLMAELKPKVYVPLFGEKFKKKRVYKEMCKHSNSFSLASRRNHLFPSPKWELFVYPGRVGGVVVEIPFEPLKHILN